MTTSSFLNQNSLPEQLQNAHGLLVGMSQHRSTCIHQDLVSGKFCHLLCHISIAEDRLGTLHIFMGNSQPIKVALQGVLLKSTHLAALNSNFLNRTVYD